MIERFRGTVEAIAPVEISDAVAWISAIDFAHWPQQHRLADGKIRPAMVSDLTWHGFATVVMPIVCILGCVGVAYQFMLSAVMPGHSIEPHRDWQSPDWRYRVHVPLLSNLQSKFVVGGETYELWPGIAYRVNTEAEHSVVNLGDTPRVHFMFDVRIS